MSHFSRMRGTALAALVTIGGLGGIDSAYALSDANEASNAVAPMSASAGALTIAQTTAASSAAQAEPASMASGDDARETEGNVGELQRLVKENKVTELRTTYNGTYGASLLLDTDDMAYYVVLFQQKNFWRVLKTQDDARAEAIYADFVRKSAQLADVEVRRAKLAAQKAYTDHLIALSQARVDRLQADIDVAHQQQAAVAERQKAAHAEAAALDAQKRAAQDQLRQVRRHARQLQRQTEEGLPTRRHH